MSVDESRQHFRIEDQIYFDYKLIQSGELCADKSITEELLAQNGKRYLEMTQYFQNLDHELSILTKELVQKTPALTHYLNLINAKIDFIARHLTMSKKIHLREVNISLGGMAFKTKERIKESTQMKIVIYTKPKMLPLVLDAVVIYSQYHYENQCHTAVQFAPLDKEQEHLLSQHIILAQSKCRAV
jgi:PilZ domain